MLTDTMAQNLSRRSLGRLGALACEFFLVQGLAWLILSWLLVRHPS